MNLSFLLYHFLYELPFLYEFITNKYIIKLKYHQNQLLPLLLHP